MSCYTLNMTEDEVRAVLLENLINSLGHYIDRPGKIYQVVENIIEDFKEF